MSLSTEQNRTASTVNPASNVRKFMFDCSFDGAAGLRGAKASKPKMTYSQEQLDAACQKTFNEGRAAGQKAAMDSQQQNMNVLLSQIDRQLSRFIAAVAQDRQSQIDQMKALSLAIVRKIIPVYAERHGLEEVECLIGQALKEMSHEPRLVIRVNNNNFDAISTKINDLAARHAFSGKVVVLAEDSLGPADCRIEWADGGVERDSKVLWQTLERLTGCVQNDAPEPPQPKNESSESGATS